MVYFDLNKGTIHSRGRGRKSGKIALLSAPKSMVLLVGRTDGGQTGLSVAKRKRAGVG